MYLYMYTYMYINKSIYIYVNYNDPYGQIEETYTCVHTKISKVLFIKTLFLFGAKPLSESTLTYCQIDPYIVF